VNVAVGTDRPKHSVPPPPGDGDEEQEERPTVVPRFDPAELAKGVADSARGEKARVTPLGVPAVPPEAYRRAQGTYTNEAELEEARRLSEATSDAQPETVQMNDSTRTSLLSMVDSRAPSGAPTAAASPASASPPPQGRSTRPPPIPQESFSQLDRGWEDLNLDDALSEEPPTRPAAAPIGARTGGASGRRSSGRMEAASGEDLFTVKDAASIEVIAEAPERDKPVLADESPPASRGMPREEPPVMPRGKDEDTPFTPARSAAALTSPPPAGTASPSATPGAKPEISEPPAASSFDDTIREMRDRFSLGDYTGALVLAEGLLEDAPHDPEVRECAENCRQVLRQMYTARIGPLDRVPVVTVARDQLRWLSIDHRAGFVLSHIDGVSSLEMILDVSGMPLLDALRILCELAQQRIISFR